jgi:hypothetical protein
VNVDSQIPSLSSSGIPKNCGPFSFGFPPTSKVPFTPHREKIPPKLHESWTMLPAYDPPNRNLYSNLPLHSMHSETFTRASIPAVSELLRKQPTLPIKTTKHTKVRSKPLKPSLLSAPQSLSWMQQPRDPTVRAVASCTAVTFGPDYIHCHVSFKSQILPPHKILVLASDLQQPLKALMWSLQIGTNTLAPLILEDLESTLRQAHDQEEFVRVCWKEAVFGLDQLREEGQNSLMSHIFWSQLHMAAKSLVRLVYRDTIVILSWSFLSMFFGALFGFAYVRMVSYAISGGSMR